MVVEVRHADIWWVGPDPFDQRRPVLVVTRQSILPFLTSIVVAPITRRIRGIITEIALGPSDGLGERCVASFDNLQTVHVGRFERRVGSLGLVREAEICSALEALAGC